MGIKVGLDVGGVLTDQLANDNTDTAFKSDNFMNTTAVPGSFDAVRKVVGMIGAENTYIISKCGPVIEQKTRLWLDGKGFYEYTGFTTDPAHLRFCLERRDKAPIAAKLGLTHFVDDHREVLGYMAGIVENRILFGPQVKPAPDDLVAATTWPQALACIFSA